MLQPKKKQKAIEAPGTQVAETKEQPANSAVPARSGTQVAPPAAVPAIEDRKPAYSAVKTCGGELSIHSYPILLVWRPFEVVPRGA